ncbi:helix-turn-helix transcriptional regulator [Phyllobacterium sp.]|uniref:helix-turn-helix domain-containing protein n=1 Tax=unclassified Phyllobacterium TaxID=2638441 RepID=UPI001ACB4304|nr:helix-turn-helix transcriptional regulator [Phyllobacterium sp.]MBQ9350320.1 helix-turn-helix transcriptional regulator [Phyllobacterium sp.]
MDSRQIVGRNVRRIREEMGLSQEQLAFETELHRTYISGVERGVRNPTVLVIDRLAKALGVPPHLLLMPGSI